MAKPVNLYINTLIFSVIAGIVSLMLLLLLVFGSDVAADYMYLIVTVEVGLLTIMVVALWRTFEAERDASKLRKNALNNTIGVTSCPDYWVASQNATAQLVCSNKLMAKNGDTYLIKPAMSGTTATYTGLVADTNGGHKLNVGETFDGKKLSEVCGNYQKMGVPWTDVRSACMGFGASV